MGPLHQGGKNDLHSLRKETIGEGYIIFYFENNVRMYVFLGRGGVGPIREAYHPKKEKQITLEANKTYTQLLA
jgi:hypothetical protein